MTAANLAHSDPGCAFCRVVSGAAASHIVFDDVVPRRRQDGLRGFFWPCQRYASGDEMRRFQDLLRAAVTELLCVRNLPRS
jgi:hypothetical protein